MEATYSHVLHIQGVDHPVDDLGERQALQQTVAAWLAALLGAEHVSLLVGSGLGLSLSYTAGVAGLGMGTVSFAPLPEAESVEARAAEGAAVANRGEVNIEDQLRAALELHAGLSVLDASRAGEWRDKLDSVLTEFAQDGLAMEKRLSRAFELAESFDEDPSHVGVDETSAGGDMAPPTADAAGASVASPAEGRAASALAGARAKSILSKFLLAFAGRPPSRERLKIFTTNYDRLLEYGADAAGIRILDRFVGSLEPMFRASRLDIDMHFNPPGIRGEPRFMEGVVHLTKLHGSLDWRFERRRLRRIPLRFGANDPQLQDDALQRLMVYPNAAKDVETLQYPYAELFRDFAAALCRPNSVLFTYGYGFGDDHINRVIADMLTLSSTHIAVLAHSDPGGRIERFLAGVPSKQYTLLLGTHYGDLGTLVDQYLPQLGADPIFERLKRRIDGDDAATRPRPSSQEGALHGNEPAEPTNA